jgi:tetratricopeptide (TPR) repeat protein
VQTDRQGNPMPGASASSAELFDRAVESFNVYRGDPLAPLDAAIAEAPRHAMAHLLKAWLLALATEPAAAAEAERCAMQAAILPLGEREESHLAGLRELLQGNWVRAAVLMDGHNARWPHDLVGLQVGHLMDFFRGNARDLRDRIARALPAWSTDRPGHGILLGMYAFGLEECGDYARAEDAGRRAVDADPRDCWAHHAVAHVMEMQGRAEDGIGWMMAREPWWADDANFFKVHNWWHRALCHLDLGQTEAVLALYDGAIRGTRSTVALDLVDASALLWRLSLTGADVGERWGELTAAWDAHADGRLYPFNDWHAAMAYLGAERMGDVERLLAALRETGEGRTDVAGWARGIAVPLIEAFTAFRRGDYAATAETLHPLRHVAHAFGGSHAQRDIIDWTMTEAAIRAGQPDLARSYANERIALKAHSPVNRDFLRRSTALR